MTQPADATAEFAKASEARPRLAIVDAWRGVALVAMFVYHLGWDLAYFRYIGPGVVQDPVWRGFAISIAGSFLLLVGVSLVLAARGGMNWSAYGWRLATIVAAAALVTGATYYLFPASFIFFGILHSIAVASVLGLPFLRAPLWLVALAAFLVFMAPFYFADPYFDAWEWRWLGLMTYFPETNDYEPVLPWFAATLVGILLMRSAIRTGLDRRLAQWRGVSWPARLLRFGGRHSLWIYLIHQPLLFGAVWLVALIAPAPGFGPLTAERYPGFCRANCEQGSTDPAFCTAYCACLSTELTNLDLLVPLVENRLSTEQQHQVAETARQCQASAPPAAQ